MLFMSKKHPLKEFQVHIFPFDWVFGVVTFLLILGFHPIFSYPKPHGLTWDQGGCLIWYLKKICFNFRMNLICKSKVIGPPSWVLNLGINGGEAKWPRINLKVLNWFYSDSWVTLHLSTCILTQNFYPWILICVIIYWRVREELGWERKNTIFQLQVDLTTSQGKFFSKTKMFNEENSHSTWTSLLSP